MAEKTLDSEREEGTVGIGVTWPIATPIPLLESVWRPFLSASSSSPGSYQIYKTVAMVLIIAVLLHRVVLRKQTKKYHLFPGWAALEIAVVSHLTTRGGLGRRIYTAIRRRGGGSLYGLTWTHQVLVNLPDADVDRIMAQSHHTLSAEPVQYTLFTRVFGATDSPVLKAKLEDSWRDLLGPVERMFLDDAAATAALEKGGGVFQKAAGFVSFSSNPKRMRRWELSADVRVVKPDSPGRPGAVEANLQSLARDFGACIAIPLLYGQDFLARYPGLLDGFWNFDNDLFPLLAVGVPTWLPIKVVRDGLAARSRLLKETEALYRRIDQYQQGQQVDFGADLTDISRVALDRNRNANTQSLLFWLLVYVYSTPGLCARIREEMEPYVDIAVTASTGDGNRSEITSVDASGLCRDCVLLKACVFETCRMANEATSIRYVARPFTINETDGAVTTTASATRAHKLERGMFVSVPHSLGQRDPSVYVDPDKFNPDRFLEVDQRDSNGTLVARYGRLKPWGSGAAMCKGRTFAEKQIMLAAAAIIGLWDISPAGDGGDWEVPDMMPGTGVKKPKNDVRVVITPRHSGPRLHCL
ncbi:hypothetical protein PV08_08335 [Exophiala spinifera]|uniref:Cytochrome P450 n=1 Tax=Exophiala spinifera TaxID=91928 RepID=A0A0D2B2K5_9EURO|nr:uncharacterized protein PV08_08335 [Exophiala spinifera]KIW13148.1 hypothetical protein PV08_08335 [Exophiala spinifera]